MRSFLVSFGDAEGVPSWCAVTADDEREALTLISRTYRPDGDDLPEPVSIEALPPAAIQERIGNFDFGVPVARGIWYPHINNP